MGPFGLPAPLRVCERAEPRSLKFFLILEVSGFRFLTMNEQPIQHRQEVHAVGYSEAPWHF